MTRAARAVTDEAPAPFEGLSDTEVEQLRRLVEKLGGDGASVEPEGRRRK